MNMGYRLKKMILLLSVIVLVLNVLILYSSDKSNYVLNPKNSIFKKCGKPPGKFPQINNLKPHDNNEYDYEFLKENETLYWERRSLFDVKPKFEYFFSNNRFIGMRTEWDGWDGYQDFEIYFFLKQLLEKKYGPPSQTKNETFIKDIEHGFIHPKRLSTYKPVLIWKVKGGMIEEFSRAPNTYESNIIIWFTCDGYEDLGVRGKKYRDYQYKLLKGTVK